MKQEIWELWLEDKNRREVDFQEYSRQKKIKKETAQK